MAARITSLANGLRVATLQRPGVVGVQALVGSGSRNDAVGGSASILANNIFAGKAQAEQGVCNLGGAFTVSVGREETSFGLTVTADKANDAIKALGDAVSKPSFDEKAWNERKVSHAATLEHDTTLLGARSAGTEELLVDRLHVSTFRDGSLGNPLHGEPDSVAAITGAALKDFHANNYNSNKTVVAVSGPVDHEAVVKAAEAAFGGLSTKAIAPVTEKPYFLGADLRYRNDEMGKTAYMALGYEGVPHNSSDSICFDLMAQLIGEYDSSAVTTVPAQISGNRVIQEISKKSGTGCADYYKVVNQQFSDTGVFYWYAACDEVATEHCSGELIFGANVLTSAITEEEVSRAKRELKRIKNASVAGNVAAAETIAQHINRYGRHISTQEYNQRLDGIDSEDVKRVAYKYLHDVEVSVSALGPLHGLPDHYHLRKNTHMWRY